MRIITWNVNGIRATHKKWELARIITEQNPDILFMQEIKATTDKLTEDLLSPIPYIAYYNSAEKPGYAGTGAWIHSRLYERYDVEFLSSFPLDPTANEGRVAHVQLKKKELIGKTDISDIETIVDIFGIYFPNGGKSEQAWQDKLVFYSEFAKYMDELREQGHMVLWWGDINCAHAPIDLARPKENDGKIWFHPLERAWLDGRVRDGWHDIWREQYPDMQWVYSWWDPVTRSRDRNVWWRIDALWWEDDIVAKIRNIEYLPNQMGSDHCPMMVDIDV
jgi:exodeoxyribonuclease-3